MTADLLDLDIVGDFEFLSKRKGSNVYAELLGRFAAGWPTRMADMTDALAAADQSRLSRQLHSVKGAAASLGLCALSGLAGQGEAQANTVDTEALQALDALAAASLVAARGIKISLT